MTVKTAKFDAAERLRTPEDIAAFIAKALGVAARAKGMSDLAQSTGRDRASLYKALSEDGRPSFDTVVRVTRALGLRIAFEPAPQLAAT